MEQSDLDVLQISHFKGGRVRISLLQILYIHDVNVPYLFSPMSAKDRDITTD